jgi:dCTP deaminase
MSTLVDWEIVAARDAGDIVIDPFDERNLGSDTYDVRLGEYFFRERWALGGELDPRDERSALRAFGDAQKADDGIIRLEPGETILAHTQEFIGGARRVTTRMSARSSVGRSLFSVCKCAGKGDVGYISRWTMEITSFARYHTIVLHVGMRVAQIEFTRTGVPERIYGRDHRKYQTGTNIEEIKKNWSPYGMLPRLFDDWEVNP